MTATQTTKTIDAPQEVPLARDPAHDARLRRLVAEHYDFVWRMLRRLGVRPPLTDDAAQRVFLTLSSKLAIVEAGAERTYLCGIISRIASRTRRDHARLREVPEENAVESSDDSPSPEVLLDRKKARAVLDSILTGMSEEHRTAFVLFEFEGLKMREIAQLLELPMGTVASRLRLARYDFQAALQRAKRAGALGSEGGQQP